jgi:hypothetical protein
MKHNLASSLLSAFICATLSAACQPSSYVPPTSGIEFKLSSLTDREPPLRPDGLFRVEALDGRRSVHVPVTPQELGSTVQRIELPPGSYTVSYSPVELGPSLVSLRQREAVKSLSHDPFLVVVSKGRFTTINVRAVDAVGMRPRRALDTAATERSGAGDEPTPRQ